MSSQFCSVDALEELVTAALVAARTSEANARSVARALVAAEIDGQSGHGLSRVASYAAQARVGKVDGHAVPAIASPRPATLMVDVAHGFVYPALELALPRLVQSARSLGIAAAAFYRSHHFGVAGRHVEWLADQGLVALAFANTPKAIAAWGGRTATLGTNPLAFAAPRRAHPPLVVDMALSEVARGRIMAAKRKGESIPEGWALDADGLPTTDPTAALAGTLLPAGGAKGAALALMVELMAVALSGARLAGEASAFLDAEGGPPATGQFVIAVDPAGFAGSEVFAERMDTLFAMIAAEAGVRLPGTRRLAGREAAACRGLPVDAGVLAEIKSLVVG